jgi:hypothetical protein
MHKGVILTPINMFFCGVAGMVCGGTDVVCGKTGMVCGGGETHLQKPVNAAPATTVAAAAMPTISGMFTELEGVVLVALLLQLPLEPTYPSSHVQLSMLEAPSTLMEEWGGHDMGNEEPKRVKLKMLALLHIRH